MFFYCGIAPLRTFAFWQGQARARLLCIELKMPLMPDLYPFALCAAYF